MDYVTWQPVYEEILADFGFDRTADERARDLLGEMVEPFDLGRLQEISGATVAVAGAGPSLPDELELAREADFVLAASTATDVLVEAAIEVDLMVTDLDKNPDTVRRLTDAGTPVAVHAHGDNIPAIHEHVPTFAGEHVLATTQAEPTAVVQNFGGFTDGDRTAFLADHFGAEKLVFPGWDLDDPSVSPEKRKKLQWAARLLRWLERRRDEEFAVLDGQREEIDVDWQPQE